MSEVSLELAYEGQKIKGLRTKGREEGTRIEERSEWAVGKLRIRIEKRNRNFSL